MWLYSKLCVSSYVHISIKDDGNCGEVKCKTTEDDSATKEGPKDKISIATEDSIVKEKEANKEKNTVPSLSKENSMEESLLCGICQVSILHTCNYAYVVSLSFLCTIIPLAGLFTNKTIH